jgi:hypothetical protein
LTKADKIQILQEKVVVLNEKIEQLNGMKRQIEKFMGRLTINELGENTEGS